MTETTHQSGASRLCSSVIGAVFVAPLLILGMCVLLGYNEQRAVCDEQAITVGEGAVQQMRDCTKHTKVQPGQLVMFSCDLKPEKLSERSDLRDFGKLPIVGIGLRLESQIYQCVEKKHSTTRKDIAGGGKTTVTEYTYKEEWVDKAIDSAGFSTSVHESEKCGGQSNKAWDSSVPHSITVYQAEMKVGPYTTNTELAREVPLDSSVKLEKKDSQALTDAGWQTHGSGGSYYKSRNGHTMIGGEPNIGDMKVRLYTNDPTKLTVTVLGKDTGNGGRIEKWRAPASWLCSGSPLHDLRMGTLSVDELFQTLSSENTIMTWIMRFVGFGIMWFAFSLCFGPLEVAADCIPCIGPCLGDGIEAIACCLSCLPATACTLGVAGIVWAVMRPLVGIPLMLFWVLIMGFFGHFIIKKRAEKQGRNVMEAGLMTTEMAHASFSKQTAQPVAVAQPVQTAQPVAQRQMQVQVPMGYGAGQMMQFQTPDGNMMQAAVPQGIAQGGIFMVNY